MKKYTITWLLAALMISCQSGANDAAKHEIPEDTTPNETGKETTVDLTTDPSQLLQGRWQNTEDTSNYLVFEDNIRKETAAGAQGWYSEPYILTDRCLNESNQNTDVAREKARYISCKKSDLCWYIVALTKNSLHLSYMGRGNSLQYTKVN